MTPREAIALLLDTQLDQPMFFQTDDGQRVAIVGIDCDALRVPAQPTFLVTQRPLALAPLPACDEDGDATCYCKGGRFAAEHGEELAAEFRKAVSA